MNIPAYSMDKGAIYSQLLNEFGLNNDRDGGIHDLMTVNSILHRREKFVAHMFKYP